jgi:hypothetical protein
MHGTFVPIVMQTKERLINNGTRRSTMLARRRDRGALGRRMRKAEEGKDKEPEGPSANGPTTTPTPSDVETVEPNYVIHVVELNGDEGDVDTTAAIEATEEPERRTLFQKLLAPECVDTDASTSEEEEDSEPDPDDGSLGSSRSQGSATYYSSSDGGDGSRTLLDGSRAGAKASDNSIQGSTSSTDRCSDSSSLIAFDEDLMARHRGACKNMRVSVIQCGS